MKIWLKDTFTLRIDDFLPNKNGDFENYTIEIEDYKTSKTSQWIIKNTIYKINKDFHIIQKNYSGINHILNQFWM